jgi:catechol 2,3-dioxygenase-like lactoylglutathione lyase family enzyme
MQIKFVSVSVTDQEQALRFYEGVLGFVKKADIAMGPYRWLTVESPDGIAGVELILEAVTFAPARVYQQARFEAGMPAVALTTADIQADYARLTKLGVVFRGEPTNAGPVIMALFEDTCGNLINLAQPLM